MNNIIDFKNKYTGKRIFIVGNGPSINSTPLEKLIGEYSIAMNRISLIYERTKWRPSFFVCTTTNIKYPDWHKDIMHTINLGVVTFAWDELRDYIKQRDNVYFINCTNGEQTTPYPSLNWWSDDISKRVCKYGTSMLVAFQLAFYMGFKEIYILGADLGYKDSFPRKLAGYFGLRKLKKMFPDNNHFSTSYDTPGCPSTILNRNMVAAHKLVKTIAEKKGINIFNATNGGNLEVYPRVNLLDVLCSSSIHV